MPHERPDAFELIEAVREFLMETVMPGMPGQAGFHARVAANALAIAGRELRENEALSAAEGDRLRRLLDGMDGTADGPAGGTAEELNWRLIHQLRDGDLAVDRAALLDHMRRTVRDKLGLSNPKYLLPEDRPETP